MPKTSPKLVTFRAAAALPAAGAWDAAPLVVFTEDSDDVAIYLSYTRGGAGGSVRIRIEVSPYSLDMPVVQSWYYPSVKSVGAFAAGADVASALQRESGILYTATGAAIENALLGTVGLGRAAARIRVYAQEVGNVGAPGTLHVVGSLGTFGLEA